MNSQHPDFLLSSSDCKANLEVISGWGNCINSSECFHKDLNRGFQVGFIGVSDGHRRTPGLGGGQTVLRVREFTLAGSMEALRSRRCYATAGTRLGLQFWVNEAFMGQVLPAARSCRARVCVHAPRVLERPEVLGDGEVVAAFADLPAQCEVEVADLPACNWYYVRVTMAGNIQATPPILRRRRVLGLELTGVRQQTQAAAQ